MARMLHDWSSEGQSIPPVVKATGIVVAAFLVTGLLYFAVQQAMSVASNRVGNRYARFDENQDTRDAAPITPTFTAPLNGPQSFGNVGMSSRSSSTGGVMRFNQAVPSNTPASPSANLSLTNDLFTNDEERTRARTQVKALRGTLTVLKQYDSRSLWAGVVLLEKARQAEAAAVNTPPDDSNTVSLRDSENPENADEAGTVRRNLTSKLLGELEAINTEVALSSHPELFPKPMHDNAEAVGRAMRTYLETARMAVARPYESDVLKNRASKELVQVEELVRTLELPLTGGASAAN